MGMSAEQWLTAYAAALGLDAPTPEETEALLALAGVAAHASERIAAPISCYLAARSGIPLPEALARACALTEGAHSPDATRSGAE